MKFCKDCAHIEAFKEGSMTHYLGCVRPVKLPPDPVDGSEQRLAYMLSSERAKLTLREKLFGTKRCGPDGRFWTPAITNQPE